MRPTHYSKYDVESIILTNKQDLKSAHPRYITIIDNFIEKDDLQILDELCRYNKDSWWYEKIPCMDFIEHTSGEYRELCMKYAVDFQRNRGHQLLDKYMDKAKKVISYEVGHQVVPIFNFNRHQTLSGGFCPGHTDSEGIGPNGISYLVDYSPMHIYEPSLIDISANIYINNDYDGGQLYFEAYDIEITHTPGQLVFFPGSVEYNHGVRKISNGTRWNLITHFARPKLITMHSAIHNMYSKLSDEQRASFPLEWNDGYAHRGSTGENP
jgi:hypothetical protein